MTTQLQSSIDAILKECREIIELADKATPGEWVAHKGWGNDELIDNEQILKRHPNWCEVTGAKASISGHFGFDDASFIARSRTITPKAARGVVGAIEAIKELGCCHSCRGTGEPQCTSSDRQECTPNCGCKRTYCFACGGDGLAEITRTRLSRIVSDWKEGGK